MLVRWKTFLGFDLVLMALRQLRLRPSFAIALVARIYLLEACELRDESVSSSVSPKLLIVSTRCHHFNSRVATHSLDADMSCYSFFALI